MRGIIAAIAITLAASNQPFRIVGNLYYVGLNDVTSYLITTPKGHILIDGGYPDSAPIIRENIAKLGFRIEDVRILLNSHAHIDHAGGLAQLRKWSDAKFIASKGDAPQLERGGADDRQFGNRFLFPPIEPDRLIDDGDRVELGGTTLIAHVTPGHTPGCTTWTTRIAGENVVFVGSPTVPKEYKLNPAIDAEYRRTFAVLKSLQCDIFLGSHGGFFDLGAKRAHKKSFVDPKGYRAFVKGQERAFEKAAAR